MLSPKSSSDIDSQSDSDSLNIHKKLLDFYRHENKTLHTKISKIDAKITEMHTYEQYDCIFKSLNDKQKRAEYKAKKSKAELEMCECELIHYVSMHYLGKWNQIK